MALQTYKEMDLVIKSKHIGLLVVFLTTLFGCDKSAFQDVPKGSASVSSELRVAERLVTPNPIEASDRVYQYLRSNYSKKILSALTLTMGSNDEFDRVREITGKEAAMVSLDFMHSGRGYSWWDDEWPIEAAQAYWNKKCIPIMMWHWRDPSRQTEDFYANATSFDVSKIEDPSSAEYTAIIGDIDYVAGELKKLQDAGIPVIWRPIHEGANQSFWWGAKGAAAYKKLYQTMFDRMVNYHGLKNLIWVYTAEPGDNEWYPGDEYVDVVGRDMYSAGDHSSQVAEFNRIYAQFSGKKMVAFTEAGSIPDPDKLKEDKAGWLWFQVWSGDYITDPTWNAPDLMKKVFNSDYVITLDEMPSFKE